MPDEKQPQPELIVVRSKVAGHTEDWIAGWCNEGAFEKWFKTAQPHEETIMHHVCSTDEKGNHYWSTGSPARVSRDSILEWHAVEHEDEDSADLAAALAAKAEAEKDGAIPWKSELDRD